MEKVFTNSVAKEILLKGSSKEGPVDLFSYNNNNRALGNLYVIGNIQGGNTDNTDDIDVGYVLNLVASLAKREYYNNQEVGPKDAFSSALKKINGVVEEFFKNKETKINIGVFAIAGDQIHISKLGKFKIILARDGKNIDILNNIQLFNKESTQEKEFSNIISGKVAEGDRILAFYPSRSTTAREKVIKDNFLKSSQDDFIAHLATIKESRPEFACAAFHVDIQKGTEMATAPRVQPKELQEEPTKELEPSVQLADTEEVYEEEEISQPVVQTVAKIPIEPAIPKIIPSEFARGKRELSISKYFRRIKNVNITPKVKIYTIGGIAVVALLAIFGLKSFIFIDSTTRQLNTTISEIQTNIKLAEEKSNQSDFIGARNLLASSLSILTQSESVNGSSQKTTDTKNKLILALDNLDNATNAELHPVAEIPSSSGAAKLITLVGNNFYAYLDQGEAKVISKIIDGSITNSTPITDIRPSLIFSSAKYVALVDLENKKLTSLSIDKSTLITKSFSSDNLLNLEVYQDNFYGLTSTNIIKITDAALGKTDVQPWLTESLSLATDAKLIAVDGNIYTLSSNGTLATYYKGKKTNEVTTPVSPGTKSILLTTTDSPNLYLVDMITGRIYILSKTTGVVSKTLKINSSQPISSVTLSANETIYILSGNKIWEVK